jgi:ferrochelatase
VPFSSSAQFRHEPTERIGILLVNSGTPASLATRDVRRFLKGLLSDRRVVELPRLLWLPILYGLILPIRPYLSARRYRLIWTAQGSPMTTLSNELASALSAALARRTLGTFSVEVAMLYGPPTVAEALERLRSAGAQRLLVLPLYPQYSGASSGAAFDQVTSELRRWRWLPQLRFIDQYAAEPLYIEALAASVEQHWQTHGRTRRLLVSFHGIPERYFDRGDPYLYYCQKSARLLAQKLQLPDDAWSVSFHSRFGAARWLGPYTADVVAGLPGQGVKELTVICPGFAIDCLETLEEIAIENRDRFLAAGGERFLYVPALNARGEHVDALGELITRNCQGWSCGDDETRAAARIVPG